MFWKKKKQTEEVKPLGKQVSWDEWDKCELLPAAKSHLVSVFTKERELINYVLGGLVDLDIIFKEDIVHLVIHSDALKNYLNETKTNHETFMVCMSDDPSMEYAGDWTQMGCMRIFFVVYNPSYEWDGKHLVVTCAKKDLVIQDSYNEVSVDKVIA